MLSYPVRIVASLFIGLPLLAAVPSADAQTTLHLTTPQQTNCTVTTDSQGIRLVPGGGTDMMASGAALTGSGCGAAAEDYQTSVSVPGTAVAGTSFNVTWAASSQATQCTYAGTTGVAGWPVGTSACQGAACSGSHLKSVNVSAAGNYVFAVTCTNSSGFDQGNVSATNPPLAPQPPNFALTATPSTAVVGTPIQVSWSVTGATTCTGSASLNGSSTSLPGWTDVTTASTPRTISPTAAGAYTLGLDCSNNVGHAVSVPYVLTISSNETDNCPAGRQTVADICYSYSLSGCAAGTDVTKFENIWGRTSASDPPSIFPGANVFAIFKNLDKTQYIAAKFTASQSLLSTLTGLITHGSTYPGPNLTMSISSACGDFNPSASICARSNLSADGYVKYKNALVPDSTAVACPITAGQTYFVNIKATNPAQTSHDCSGNSCKVTVQLNH